MAKVTLDRCYLADVADLGYSLVFGTTDRSDADQLMGKVEEMANGRLRSVTRKTSRRALDITAVWVSPDVVETLREWRGRVVLFRDVWGRKIYGVYYDIDVRDYKDRSGQDVSFTLQKITYDESV